MLTFKLLLCFALALAPSLAAIDSPAAAAAASQRRKRDVLKFLADATHSQAEPAASQWGFADAMATVGKAFLYKLPTHVFKDSVKSYKVSRVRAVGFAQHPGQSLKVRAKRPKSRESMQEKNVFLPWLSFAIALVSI